MSPRTKSIRGLNGGGHLRARIWRGPRMPDHGSSRRRAGSLPARLLALASLVSFTSFDAFSFQQPPVFRSRSDIVHLDVSVLDKNRRPVRGLTQGDFTVLEDGKPQQVSIFEAIDVPDPEP